MDATCTIQDSIHVFNLVHKYVSRILGTYHFLASFQLGNFYSTAFFTQQSPNNQYYCIRIIGLIGTPFFISSKNTCVPSSV